MVLRRHGASGTSAEAPVLPSEPVTNLVTGSLFGSFQNLGVTPPYETEARGWFADALVTLGRKTHQSCSVNDGLDP
jgi:hypothetical protein